MGPDSVVLPPPLFFTFRSPPLSSLVHLLDRRLSHAVLGCTQVFFFRHAHLEQEREPAGLIVMQSVFRRAFHRETSAGCEGHVSSSIQATPRDNLGPFLKKMFDCRIEPLTFTSCRRHTHERAGSRNVLHLHGEVLYARSTRDPSSTRHLGDADIAVGDLCPLGSQLRPHMVWFGEMVPAMDEASEIVAEADIFLCIGTSLQVYPANSLIFAAPRRARRIVVNPEIPDMVSADLCECIATSACEGVPTLVTSLLQEA
jgi:hypothetical protein